MASTEVTLERESRLQRLKDNLTALQDRYAELLQSAKMGTALQQDMSEFQSSVLSTGVVESIENLLHLVNDLRRAALLQHTTIAEEVSILKERYSRHEREGNDRLQVMQAEMQAALCEIELAYYSSPYR
ncbi:MAG: hypothetical protein SGPRY_013696 [Prymnesium sp.]